MLQAGDLVRWHQYDCVCEFVKYGIFDTVNGSRTRQERISGCLVKVVYNRDSIVSQYKTGDMLVIKANALEKCPTPDAIFKDILNENHYRWITHNR